jgi:hypothetical protein
VLSASSDRIKMRNKEIVTRKNGNLTALTRHHNNIMPHLTLTYVPLIGAVPTEKRQSLVDSFNRASDPRFLFLLSSKAGGVGINL